MNKKMKNASFCLTAASCIALSPTASATGVTAGTEIVNTASATYNTGTATSTVQSNTVTVKVDELLDVAVSSQDGSALTISSTQAILTFSVTNTGNGNEAFLLTANPAISGNDFDAVVQTVAIDSNGNGIYDAGTDTVITNGGASSAIAPDDKITVFVVLTLPAGAADADNSQVRLTAEAQTGTGSPGAVFTGQGQGGGDAVAGTTGADDDDQGALVASLGSVTLVKSYTITDPFGGAQPVPGASVTYSIKATVAGSGQVEGLHVVDVIPTNTTYQTGSLKLGATSLTDSADADAGEASASGIDVDLGTIPGGEDRTVTFKVTIN